ncbi:transposase (plasmid) [Fischerella sp. NIES-4106]|nr:transposase [Fischerella sp. NIES-4106]
MPSRIKYILAKPKYLGAFALGAKATAGHFIIWKGLDGKTIRGSYDRNQSKSALHLISAWASEQSLVLAQMKVEDKSNEITAIPALLELLDIAGSIITIDAMGTQTEIAKQIIDNKADYVLALKANHPTLYSQVTEWFENALADNFLGIDVSYNKRIEKGHHRTEIREVWTVPVTAIGELYQPKLWAGLQTLVMVVRVRHLWNKTTREVQFYLTSLNSDAQLIGRAIRKHWGIENQAHWTLDCTFSEDACLRAFFPQSQKFCPSTTHCSECSQP